jgi:hypothetical protein
MTSASQIKEHMDVIASDGQKKALSIISMARTRSS